MTALDRILNEQRRCRDLILAGHPEQDGLKGAIFDWVAEEVLTMGENVRMENTEYQEFLQSKRVSQPPSGFSPTAPISPMLFDFQRDIVRWAIKRGKAAVFADCGLGKTAIQVEWARHVAAHTGTNVLIVAPLSVAEQTVEEGDKFGVPVALCRKMSDVRRGVNVTNYEMLGHFTREFGGVVIDESSILKGDGPMRRAIQDFVNGIPFRLACTATPAPNDHVELGNHSEFLGLMSRPEMLATFFVHDGGDTSKWRLKGHAAQPFLGWVASWAVALRSPSDLGYDDGKFILPELRRHAVVVDHEFRPETLFSVEAKTLEERRAVRRSSLEARVSAAVEVAAKADGQCLLWCDLNAEQDAIARALGGECVSIQGSDTPEQKVERERDWRFGRVRHLVTKPSVFGFGVNWQHCNTMVFVGLSDSWEQIYQATRRCWRFGQRRPVDAHFVYTTADGEVVRNIERKESQAAAMMSGMLASMREKNMENIKGAEKERPTYKRAMVESDRFALHLGDCVEVLREMEESSVDYAIYSPPFSSLYTYSNSERDLGNSTDEEFAEHYRRFVAPELFRVLKPGRLLSFHCMNLPSTIERDGVIGVKDFRGDLIRVHQASGLVYHSEVCIWKDPVTAMQRTKAIGLLYKQLKKDSCISRQGIPDYLVTMRKPGKNPSPVTKTEDGFPVERWQRYASPVWMDINPSDTLQRESVREEEDERHICPLQLQVIERAIDLWTNPGDVVLSPFAGIGSEGYVAVQRGRRFVGIELKPSYYDQAQSNLRTAERSGVSQTLFSASAGE